jgi:hypothetical protein
MVPLRK